MDIYGTPFVINDSLKDGELLYVNSLWTTKWQPAYAEESLEQTMMKCLSWCSRCADSTSKTYTFSCNSDMFYDMINLT